jgi:hypothetical protein
MDFVFTVEMRFKIPYYRLLCKADTLSLSLANDILSRYIILLSTARYMISEATARNNVFGVSRVTEATSMGTRRLVGANRVSLKPTVVEGEDMPFFILFSF